VFIARTPPQPASPRGPRAARARFADDQVSWDAAIAAGAIRDKSQAAHLPHVVSYLLMFRTPGHRPATQSQEQMALPGWGSPEGQGSPPPASLGHGAASFDTVQRRLTSIARQTHTRVRLGWGVPLGAAPAVVITTAAPIRLLAGPIRRYLAAVDFQGGRYDGVLVAVFDRRGNPVWAATTAERVGTRGCSVYSGEAGKSHGSFPAFSSAGDRACAAAGVEFS
jgi:hypothetical protein